MEDVKQFLNTWCAKHKLKQTYEFGQSGEKHRPMFSCEVSRSIVKAYEYISMFFAILPRSATFMISCLHVFPFTV